MVLKQTKKAIAARARYAAKKEGTYVPKRVSEKQLSALMKGRAKRAENVLASKLITQQIRALKPRVRPAVPSRTSAGYKRLAMQIAGAPALPPRSSAGYKRLAKELEVIQTIEAIGASKSRKKPAPRANLSQSKRNIAARERYHEKKRHGLL